MASKSYESAFHIEWRLYRILDWEIPYPGGIPVRAFAYFAATLLAIVLLPPFDWVRFTGDEPLRYIVAPVAVAWLLCKPRMDGRKPWQFLRSLVEWKARGLLSRPEKIAFPKRLRVRWDHSSVRPQRGRVTGPAVVTFTDPMALVQRRGALRATPSDEGTRTVLLVPRERMEVRP